MSDLDPELSPEEELEFARRDAEAAADTVLVDTGTYFVRVPKKQREES